MKTLRARGLHLAGLALLLGTAAALRLWRIDRLPPGFHFDEAFEGLEAWRILTQPGYYPVFLTGNFGVPPLNAYANAVSFAVARALGGEAGPVAMRVTAALFGVLGVWALFGLAAELVRRDPVRLSPALPWLAAASLAALRWHIHFSRMGIEPVIVPLLWAAANWLLLRGWRTGRWPAYAGCGLLLALGMYAYQAAWVIPLLVALSALHLLWADRAQRAARPRRLGGLALAAGIAVAGVAPLAWFFVQQPELLLLRPAQLVIVGQTGSPADASIGAAAWATLKMFVPFGQTGDLDPRRNLPGAPALTIWQALPFALGLLLALRRVTRPVYALPLLGLGGLLLPGVVSEYAPHFHRVLGAAAPAALLAGMGLDALWRSAARLSRRWAGLVAALLLLLAGGAAGARDYFARWAALPDLFYAFDVGLWQVGRWTAAQPPAAPLYISPRGAGHATLAFAWRDRPAPVHFDGRSIFPFTAGANPIAEQYVVIEPEDFRTRLLLPEVFPTAQVAPLTTDAAGQVYAQVYTRPAATRPARPPQVAAAVTLGDGIALAGYDAQPPRLHPGAILYLQLHWLVSAPPGHDWTVFTHVVDAAGAVVAGQDGRPGAGSLPTLRWQPGWRVLDEYQIALPAALPPGDYRLEIGLYREGTRLPPEGTGVVLGTVQLTGRDAMNTDLLPLLYRTEESFGWSVGMRAVTHALLAGLALPEGPVLEVGCGGGHLLAELRRRCPGRVLCGADLDGRGLVYAHAALPVQGGVVQAPLQRLPFGDAAFALLLALDVFDQQGVALAAALAESRRVLRPGGWLVVRVSAHRQLYGAHDLAFHTARRYAKHELVQTLAAQGFALHRVTYANFGVGGPVALWRLLQRWRLLPWQPAIYTDRTANALVAWALRAEARWLRRHDLPVGLSLWAIAEKRTTGVGCGV